MPWSAEFPRAIGTAQGLRKPYAVLASDPCCILAWVFDKPIEDIILTRQDAEDRVRGILNEVIPMHVFNNLVEIELKKAGTNHGSQSRGVDAPQHQHDQSRVADANLA